MWLLLLYFDLVVMGRVDFFFFRARFSSFHAHASLLTFFRVFDFFHSCCSHAQVFGKTLVHEFIFYSQTELYTCFFPTVQLQVGNIRIRSEKLEIVMH